MFKHESGHTSKPDLRNRALPMGEYLLMFIAQLVNDRTCIGEDKHETLRRSIIHWLAVQDMTYSQLEDKISNSLYSKSASASEIGDSKVFESTLKRVAKFRAPVGNNVGKYTLKDECWREIDIYFLHWTKMDQVKAVTNYSSFYDYKIKQDPGFFKTENDHPESPFYPPLQSIENKPIFLALDKMPANILLNPVLHEVLFGVLFNSLIQSKSCFSGSLFAYAVNIIIMALEIDQTWKRENFINNDDAHDSARSETLPYKSKSIYVNLAASVLLSTSTPKYGR